MTGPEVMDVARDAIVTLVVVASPLMLVGLVVGVAISLFQALTQIQEMTLVFVPKILAISSPCWWRCRSWPTCCRAR
jgi:flagellar biosynthesis protein FliQ